MGLCNLDLSLPNDTIKQYYLPFINDPPIIKDDITGNAAFHSLGDTCYCVVFLPFPEPIPSSAVLPITTMCCHYFSAVVKQVPTLEAKWDCQYQVASHGEAPVLNSCHLYSAGICRVLITSAITTPTSDGTFISNIQHIQQH